MADKTSDVAAGDTILATQYNNLREEVLNPRVPMNRAATALTFAGVNGASDGLTVTTSGTILAGPAYNGYHVLMTLESDENCTASWSMHSGGYFSNFNSDPWELVIISTLHSTANAALTVFSGLMQQSSLGETIPVGSSHDFVGVRQNSAGVYFVNGNGTSETATIFTPGNAARYYMNSTIKYNGTDTLKFYNNGVLKATHTTNLPGSGDPAFYHIADSTGAGSAGEDSQFVFGPMYRDEIGGA